MPVVIEVKLYIRFQEIEIVYKNKKQASLHLRAFLNLGYHLPHTLKSKHEVV
jgi:hypothetical protein